tara:strand:- start:4371 stop:4808 length:438 start_codon:yes stop_codon:yes gene_type:complete
MATNFTQEDLYVGKQILIDSDRLVFNGRDDVILSSTNLFLFKTEGEFHINTKENTFINTPKIYIGPVIDGQDPNIPAVKSDTLKLILSDLISSLKTFFSVQYPQTSGLQGPNPAINKTLGQSIISNLDRIEAKLDDIKSDKVFIR